MNSLFAMSTDKSFRDEKVIGGDNSLSRDKYLLELIFNNYYEQERRFSTVESKISSMIAFVGVIFTIQATIFSNILMGIASSYSFFTVILCFFLILSLSCYVYSIYNFIKAYSVGSYISAVNPDVICEKSKNNVDEHIIVKNLIGNVPRFIKSNEKTLTEKISNVNKGFRWFNVGSCFTLLFIIILLSYILILG